MRDFACKKNHQDIHHVVIKSKKNSPELKQLTLISVFLARGLKFVKGFFSLIIFCVALMIGSYLFFDSLIEHFFPLSKTANFLLILAQPEANSKQSCYFLSVKPSLQKYFLAALPAEDCLWSSTEPANLDALKRSMQLGVMVDQVLFYQVDSSLELQSISTKQLSQILTKLAQVELRGGIKPSQWQKAKQLLQLRQVLLHYQFQGKNFAQQTMSLNKLASFVLTDDSACTLGVLNTTATAGLAGQIATILEQSGISVLRISNSDQENYQNLAKSILISQEKITDCESEIKRLTNWLGQQLPLEIKQDQTLTDRYRSNLILLLGEDFRQQFN